MVWVNAAVASALVLAGAGAARPAARGLVPAERPIAGRYLVSLDPAAVAAPLDVLARGLAERHGGMVRRVYRRALRGFALHLPPERAEALSREPGVLLVEEDGVVEAAGLQLAPPWALDRVDQRTLPLDQAYASASGGAGVSAYVVDTGIRATHSEFGGRAVAAHATVPDGLGAPDCNGHGTAVAAALGGATYGVAKQVTLHGVRALGCDATGAVSDVVAALDWVVVNARRPAVLVLSATTSASPTLDAAVEAAISAGIPVAVAAGNARSDACLFSPARAPGALTVGASTPDDLVAFFSNQGRCVDVFAPGQDVVSASHEGDHATGLFSGTSMAVSLAAGVAALLLEVDPGAHPGAVVDALVAGATTGSLRGLAGAPDRLLYAGAARPPGSDGTPPSCAITRLSGATTFRRATKVLVSASDESGVLRVELHASGRVVATDAAPPYELVWDARTFAKGPWRLVARAVDAAGNWCASPPLDVLLR